MRHIVRIIGFLGVMFCLAGAAHAQDEMDALWRAKTSYICTIKTKVDTRLLLRLETEGSGKGMKYRIAGLNSWPKKLVTGTGDAPIFVPIAPFDGGLSLLSRTYVDIENVSYRLELSVDFIPVRASGMAASPSGAALTNRTATLNVLAVSRDGKGKPDNSAPNNGEGACEVERQSGIMPASTR